MLDLPFNPEDLGDSILASYLWADPKRAHVLYNICALLDDDGKVGDKARYYTVRNAFRRAVLRGTLIAEGIKLPSWAHENPAAASANWHFVQGYREQYNQHRQEQRERANNPTARRLSQALGSLPSPDAFAATARLSAAIH